MGFELCKSKRSLFAVQFTSLLKKSVSGTPTIKKSEQTEQALTIHNNNIIKYLIKTIRYKAKKHSKTRLNLFL
jgi:hypothetical protein